MKDDVNMQQQLLSALVDGELAGDEWEQALALAEDAQGQSDWQLYHLVGDVLRSPDLAHHCQHDVLTGLRAQLAQEPPLALAVPQAQTLAAGALEQVTAPLQATTDARPSATKTAQVVALHDPAANASVFRWKLAAGFATVAAVAAVGWHMLASQPQLHGAQLAQRLPDVPPVVAVASDNGQSVMLRDPRLDALLASQQQYASRPSLQVPAEFLRNASLAHQGARP